MIPIVKYSSEKHDQFPYNILMAASSIQKIFSGHLAAASIQEHPLFKKIFYRYSKVDLKSIFSM